MADTQSPFTSSDGLKLFRRCNACETPKGAIVFIHGIGEHTGRYSHWAKHFNNNHYLFLSFDLRGHGHSEGKRGHTPSYDRMVEDISEFTQEVRKRYPEIPLFLYGHSMGGGLVLNYALKKQNPFRGVIASAPMIRAAFNPPKLKLFMGKLLRTIKPDLALATGLNTRDISISASVVEKYKKDPLVHDKVSAQLGLSMIENGEWLLSQDNFPLPLLLLHGQADKITSNQASAQFCKNNPKNTTFKSYPGLFHEIHNEPEKTPVFEDILHWLEEVNH